MVRFSVRHNLLMSAPAAVEFQLSFQCLSVDLFAKRLRARHRRHGRHVIAHMEFFSSKMCELQLFGFFRAFRMIFCVSFLLYWLRIF